MARSFNDPDIDDYSAFLKAYWAMEETGAANRIDDVGSNDLVPTDTPGTVAGIHNLAASLNGSSEYLSIADNADLSPTTGLALSIWVYPDTLSSPRTFVYKGTDDSTFIYRLHYDGGLETNIRQSDNIIKGIGAGTLSTGAWHNVVMMATGGFVRVFIDGVSQGTPDAYDNTIKSESGDLFIGRYPGFYYWDGGIDEVAFWKNITFAGATERNAFVSALYNSGTGRFYQEISVPFVPQVIMI